MAIEYKSRGDRRSVNAPAELFEEIVEGSDIPDGPCRYLLVGTGGTANLMREDGHVVSNVPLQAGYNPLVVKQVVSLGTAADVFYCI